MRINARLSACLQQAERLPPRRDHACFRWSRPRCPQATVLHPAALLRPARPATLLPCCPAALLHPARPARPGALLPCSPWRPAQSGHAPPPPRVSAHLVEYRIHLCMAHIRMFGVEPALSVPCPGQLVVGTSQREAIVADAHDAVRVRVDDARAHLPVRILGPKRGQHLRREGHSVSVAFPLARACTCECVRQNGWACVPL